VNIEDRRDIEDRVRSATRARAALVRDTRDLELPDHLADRGPWAQRDWARRAGAERARRWGPWLIPLAAAAVIVALALSLAVVRHAAAPRPAPIPVTPAPVLANVPRYYAVITPNNQADLTTAFAIVDDHTGKQLVDFAAPGDSTMVDVSAAADDRTFLYTSKTVVGAESSWSATVIRLFPDQGQLWSEKTFTFASVVNTTNPGATTYLDTVLSPDGRAFAVLSEKATGKTTVTTRLQTYLITARAEPRTLAPLRTWTATGQGAVGTATSTVTSAGTLSWLSDSRHLAFTAGTSATGAEEREIDTTAPSGNLLKDSRVIFPMTQLNQASCGALSLTPDGGTAICGTQVATEDGKTASDCGELGLGFVAYSVPAGKPVRALASDGQACQAGTAVPVWSDPEARDVIGLFSTSCGGAFSTVLGATVGGRFYALPLPETPLNGTAIAF
jgi:hypothetical protein